MLTFVQPFALSVEEFLLGPSAFIFRWLGRVSLARQNKVLSLSLADPLLYRRGGLLAGGFFVKDLKRHHLFFNQF